MGEDGGQGPPPPPHAHQVHHQQHQIQNDAIEDEDLEDDGGATPDNGEDAQDDGDIINVPPTVNHNGTPVSANQIYFHAHQNVPHGLQPFDLSSFADVAGHAGPATWPVGTATGRAQTEPPPRTQQIPVPPHFTAPAAGAAHQVTGMMGAAMLDDSENIDDSFDEDSEMFSPAQD